MYEYSPDNKEMSPVPNGDEPGRYGLVFENDKIDTGEVREAYPGKFFGPVRSKDKLFVNPSLFSRLWFVSVFRFTDKEKFHQVKSWKNKEREIIPFDKLEKSRLYVREVDLKTCFS